MVIDGGWGLLMFFEPFSKCSEGLSYIFLITLHSITFISVDDPTLFHHWILVLGGHQEVFDGDTSSEVYLYPMFVASSFHTFTESLVVGYNHKGILVGCLVVVFNSVFLLLGRFLHLHFYSVNCPCGVLALG